jgi:hypothetical protein
MNSFIVSVPRDYRYLTALANLVKALRPYFLKPPLLPLSALAEEKMRGSMQPMISARDGPFIN